jgi:hypothetical protein
MLCLGLKSLLVLYVGWIVGLFSFPSYDRRRGLAGEMAEGSGASIQLSASLNLN